MLLAAVRSEGKIALAVASSGIAALLLEGGTTAHFRFKLPIDIASDSVCDVGRSTELAALLCRVSLIVWDEAPMANRMAFEAVDRLLQDVNKNNKLFGGKVFVCSGDFRQVLPVVRRGTRSATLDASLTKSALWEHTKVMWLRTNMRVSRLETEGRDASELKEFAAWLLDLGEGKHGAFLAVPPALLAPGKDPLDLVATVFGDMASNPAHRSKQHLLERGILTPLNREVDHLNDAITAIFPGPPDLPNGLPVPTHQLISADTLGEDDNPAMCSPENLNAMQPQGMPPHCLTLKVRIAQPCTCGHMKHIHNC